MASAEAGLLRVRLPGGLTVSGLSEADTLSVYEDVFTDACYLRHGVAQRDGDTVLDVGANTGLFALWLNTVLKRARVYCFEPVPATFAALQANLREHDRLGAEAINAGLSDLDGTAAFTHYPLFSNASTLYPDDSHRRARQGREWIISQAHTLPAPLPCLISWMPRWLKVAAAEVIRRYNLRGRRVRCRLRTLSGFLRERGIGRVDLLKVDAERSEGAILAGIDDADWPRIRQVVMEVHDGEEATARVLGLLRGRGFIAQEESNPAIRGLSIVYARRP